MNWLLKSEPSTWSWTDQCREIVTFWNGVRNHQASNYMKIMQLGDQCFFYHSGEERRIVGIVEIIRSYYPDTSDDSGRFGMVDVKYVKSLNSPVTLAAIKQDTDLANIGLVRQSRLSVMPIDRQSWLKICQMGDMTSE